MHDLRSASVNNTRMSCAAAARRLHTFLRYMSAQLFGDIERFMTGLHNSVQAKKEAMLKANHAQLRCMPVVDGQVLPLCSNMLLLLHHTALCPTLYDTFTSCAYNILPSQDTCTTYLLAHLRLLSKSGNGIFSQFAQMRTCKNTHVCLMLIQPWYRSVMITMHFSLR